MQTLWQDLRYGVRVLRKSPGFAAVAVAALALGVGVNTVIFSVVNGVLLKPLPYAEPGRLVSVWERGVRAGLARTELAPANFVDLRGQSQSFERVGAFGNQSFNLSGEGREPERVEGQRVSAEVLAMLGVEPAAGRTFLPEEDEEGRHRVVVISHGLWQRRFGSDPSVVGREVALEGQPYTIVGVMPRGFFFPDRESELWAPMAMGPDEARGRGDHYLRVVARLREGVTREQADAELATIAARLAAEHPRTNEGVGLFTSPLHDDYIGEVRTPLLVMLAAVGLVLLIACANVANLLLARATTRRRELAVRTALGASRLRLARQLLTESALLAGLGGAAGLFCAVWGVDLLAGLVPDGLSQVRDVGLDARVLWFTLGLTLLTGLVFGLAPALQASRAEPGEMLKDGARGAGAGAGGRRLRGLLVVSEVALSLVLLVGAGLLVRSFQRLRQVELGFRTDELLTMRMVLPSAKYPRPEQRRAFYDEVLRRVSGMPGVESAGMISFLPLTFSGMNFSFTVEGRPAPSDAATPMAVYRVVSPDYFRAMGIPVLRGRSFDEHDAADSPPVVVVNRSLADRFWPGEDATGKRLKVGLADSPNPWATVVGVVGDVRQGGLYGEPGMEMYASHRQDARGFTAPRDLVVRTKADPSAVAAGVRAAVWAVDSDQPVSEVRTMEQVFAGAVAAERFQTLLLGLFAGLALVLAAVGLYGVMSYTVTQRTHEIGVRMALGARRGDVLRLVITQGMWLALAGVGCGLGASLLATRLLSGMLYGVTTTDPLTYAGVPALLLAVALLACYLPARRATKVDPMEALRYE